MGKGKDKLSLLIFLFLIIAVVSGFLFKSHYPADEPWNYKQINLFSHQESNYSFTYSGDERDDEGNFKRMIESINHHNLDILFNINGGDLRAKSSQLYSFQQDYLSPGYVIRFDKPVLFVVGNHELEGDPTGKIYKKMFGSPAYYNFTEKNTYFIIIDNADGQPLNQTQMEWLKDQLNHSQSFKYRFVFMHTPLYNPTPDEEEHSMLTPGNGGADDLKSLFDDNNVTMIFASHIHNFYNGTWGDTPFIISGGAGAPAEPGHPANHHYILVNVTDENYSYRIINY